MARPAVANVIGSQNLQQGGSLDQFWAVDVTSGDPTVRFRTRYGSAVDVKRAAGLYAQGWTLGG